MSRAQPRKVPNTAEPMPPAPAMPEAVSVSNVTVLMSPRIQPLMISGKVSLFGTLNFHQSMMAAASMPIEITTTGQFSQVSNGLSNIGEVPYTGRIMQLNGVVRVQSKQSREA